MKIIKVTEWIGPARIPMYSWCDDPGDKTLLQAMNLANLPFAFHHLALMPDAHPGFGMPIGGVLATKNVVLPHCVGVDIGCGVYWVKTNIRADAVNDKLIEDWRHSMYRTVPLGVGSKHEGPQTWEGFKDAPMAVYDLGLLNVAAYQLGTLGSGNHFIELQAADTGEICIMLHSGSRRLGYDIANHFNDYAIDNCRRWYSDVPLQPKSDALAFIPDDTTAYSDYFQAMTFALDYAKENRSRMMKVAQEQLEYYVNKHLKLPVEFEDEINIHHNYAALEHHYGQDVIVHRKGATQAREGQPGIIPGDMGTSSYIVRGKGNRESFESCSHGAGRTLGRKEANRVLKLEDVKEAMKGIAWEPKKDRKGNIDLSEAPQSYKDIDAVMKAQEDLVAIVHKLRPLAAVKG